MLGILNYPLEIPPPLRQLVAKFLCLAALHDNCRQLKFIKMISFIFNKSNLLHT